MEIKNPTAFLLEVFMNRNRLKVVRAERNMTQFKLALLAGVTQSRLSYFENSLVKPTEEEKLRISKVLRVRPEDIWGGTMEEGTRNSLPNET